MSRPGFDFEAAASRLADPGDDGAALALIYLWRAYDAGKASRTPEAGDALEPEEKAIARIRVDLEDIRQRISLALHYLDERRMPRE